MEKRKFTISNASGEQLVCIEVVNSETGKSMPVVIMCHGFAYYKEEDGIFTEIAERLASNGYAVYYFDFSGCGDSEGDYEKTTLTKLVQDLHAVHDSVTSYKYVDASNVSFMGHSSVPM